jgi:hypothetical protein
MKDDFNNFIEDTFAEVWDKIKHTSETAKEYVKPKTLRERMDQNIDLKLKKCSCDYDTKEEIIEKFKQYFKEVEIESGNVYVLADNNIVYRFSMYNNGVNNKIRVFSPEKTDI